MEQTNNSIEEKTEYGIGRVEFLIKYIFLIFMYIFSVNYISDNFTGNLLTSSLVAVIAIFIFAMKGMIHERVIDFRGPEKKIWILWSTTFLMTVLIMLIDIIFKISYLNILQNMFGLMNVAIILYLVCKAGLVINEEKSL